MLDSRIGFPLSQLFRNSRLLNILTFVGLLVLGRLEVFGQASTLGVLIWIGLVGVTLHQIFMFQSVHFWDKVFHPRQ